jgi:chromosome segregation ATPase
MKAAVREQALIGILERLANEMEQQDVMLEDLIKRHDEFVKSSENAETYRRTKLNDAEKAHDKMFESFHHYRSDMLSLVNEQDRINKNIDELQKMVKTATYSLEVTNQKISSLEERLTLQEKATQEHYEHSQKQAEAFKHEIAESSRNFAKLHAETEKHFSELHKETERQLDKSQHETMRRLLMLDGIVSSLQTLLTRTEPPEKKQPWIKRLVSNTGKLFRIKLPLFFKRIFIREKE